MSLLKVSSLTISGLTLWLAPPFIFSRKIPLHNFMQGLALVSGFACCFEGRRVALKLAKAEEFEALKQAAIDSDVIHELSTSIYISEETRKKEAEELLNAQPEREENIEALKRAWLLECEAEPSEPTVQPLNQPADKVLPDEDKGFTSLNLTKNQALELIQKLRTELNQTEIIEKLWECKKGGSDAWRRAHAQFKELMRNGET
jgi:hypothetical protein